MARTRKNKRFDKKSEEHYNAENEIIIGVTTKPKEKRVDQKTTRSKKVINKKNSSKQKKKNNKKIRNEQEIKKAKIRKFIISVFIILIIIIAGLIYYLTTPIFNISNIIVKGNEKISEDTYMSLTEIKLNETNIYAISKKQIERRLKQNAYVESVKIKRKLPNTIELNIQERRTCFQTEYNNKYAYINNQGYILELNVEKLDVPILIGLESVNREVIEGKRLIENDLYKINTIFKVINYLKNNNIQNEVTSIDLSNTSNYILNMDEDKKIIYLGDASNISERMNLLKAILEREKGKKGEIFMNGNPNEDEVYFREEK